MSFFPSGTGKKIHIKVYVPSTQGLKRKISESQLKSRVREVVKFLNNAFGGTTRVLGTGSYVSDSTTVEEKVVTVESFTSPVDYKKAMHKLKDYLGKKKKQWQQQALSFEYEETLYFI